MTPHSELDSLKIFNQKAMKFNYLYFNELEKIKKISCEIVDLRSINPIDEKTILQSVKKTKNLCVIEHGWPNSSVSSDIISKVLSKVSLKNKFKCKVHPWI